MSGILNLKKYEIVLTYTWSGNNHGICGHTFEVIDYFWILKDHFNVCILIAEDIDIETFRSAIPSKYNFMDKEIEYILSKIYFINRPCMLICNNIIFTNGGILSLRYDRVIADKYIMFACGNKEVKDNVREDTFILQDHRVYEKAKVNSIEYKKKILFSRLNQIGPSKNRNLIYATKNCRDLDISFYENISKSGERYLVLTNKENKPNIISDNIEFKNMPVPNLFEEFTKYIYTPVPRKFDCSPRFIAECKYYNKEVQYDIDYLEEDLGLYWRKYDIENDFDSLYLNEDDEIIKLLGSIID